MNAKKLLGLLLSLPTTFICAEEKEINAHQMYNGQIINADSIMQLQPAMPEELQGSVNSWIAQNKELLENTIALTENIALSPEEIIHAHKEFKLRLQVHGDRSDFNAAFHVQLNGATYFIKYAGPLNTAYTAMHSQKDEAGNNYHWCQLKDFPAGLKPVPTYQTASQEATYLRLEETISQNNLQDNFFVPKTWLVIFRNSGVADQDCFIVQEAAHDFEAIRNKKNNEINPHFAHISEKTVDAAIGAIKGGALWEIYGNLLVHKEKDQLAQTDLEQPNNENAENFFHKNDAKRKHNTVAGLEGFAFLCRDALAQGIPVKTQCEYFKELLLKDPEYGSNSQLQKAVDYAK